jgi:CopG family nickel-responsive transcriptional regulator
MSELERFSITVERDLLARFDDLLARSGQRNRSEAVRDLIRARLVEEAGEGDAVCVGTLTLVYDHTRRDLADRLTEIGHEHHDAIIATMHVHLDAANCLEVITLRGPGIGLRRYADHVLGLKGVQHGRLVITAPVD